MYHYVYRITNIIENKHYYGKRSTKIEPKKDLGAKYFSSSKDKLFISDQKENPSNYKYKVIVCTTTSKKAIELEIKLHSKFDVGVNPSFYNRAKQTSVGWDTTGIPVWAGRKHTEETKRKLSEIRKKVTGWNHTNETKAKMSNAKKGVTHHNAKPVNIYDYSTGKIIAANVVLRQWCKENNVNRAAMGLSCKADITKKHSKNNVRYVKNMYARYVNA
jgi:hypothetical protein